MQSAICASIHQMVNGEPTPLGFFSKKLTAPRKKCSTFDRELLVAYEAMLHFKYLLNSRHVTMFTNHKPLQSAYRSSKPSKSDRQQCHLSILSEYVFDIQYVKREDNFVADCLPRPANFVTVNLCDPTAPASSQQNDQETLDLQERRKTFRISEITTLVLPISSLSSTICTQNRPAVNHQQPS